MVEHERARVGGDGNGSQAWRHGNTLGIAGILMAALICFVYMEPPADSVFLSGSQSAQLALKELATQAVGTDRVKQRKFKAAQESGTNQSLQMYADTPVYFGGGPFQVLQAAYVGVERKQPFERSDTKITSLAGYAGATDFGPGGLVCYHGAQPHTVYEGLGYAEVVQVTLKAKEKPEYFNVLNERNEFEALLKSYFGSFHSGSRAAGGVGYQFRNCIGLPHGMLSPLYSAVQAANTQGMALVKGKGDDPDAFNTVYIYDSNHFKFHRAEPYLQFKNCALPLKDVQEKLGRIGPTGCSQPAS